MKRQCRNCKHGQDATAQERETLGAGTPYVYCVASGPKLAGNGSSGFPTMHLHAKCSLHQYSLRKLIKSDGA